MNSDRNIIPKLDLYRFNYSSASTPKSNYLMMSQSNSKMNTIPQSARSLLIDKEAGTSLNQQLSQHSNDPEVLLLKCRDAILLLEKDVERQKLSQSRLNQQLSEKTIENQSLSNQINTLNLKNQDLQKQITLLEETLKVTNSEKQKIENLLGLSQQSSSSKNQENMIKDSQIKE